LLYHHREWTEDGQLWIQYVSSTPATRLDVINLQVIEDDKLRVGLPLLTLPVCAGTTGPQAAAEAG